MKVEAVVGKRKREDEDEYLVKIQGREWSANEWLPVMDLREHTDKIKLFEECIRAQVSEATALHDFEAFPYDEICTMSAVTKRGIETLAEEHGWHNFTVSCDIVIMGADTQPFLFVGRDPVTEEVTAFCTMETGGSVVTDGASRSTPVVKLANLLARSDVVSRQLIEHVDWVISQDENLRLCATIADTARETTRIFESCGFATRDPAGLRVVVDAGAMVDYELAPGSTVAWKDPSLGPGTIVEVEGHDGATTRAKVRRTWLNGNVSILRDHEPAGSLGLKVDGSSVKVVWGDEPEATRSPAAPPPARPRSRRSRTLEFDPEDVARMNNAAFAVLELFSGTGSVTKALRKIKGVETLSIDISDRYHTPDVLGDIMQLDFRNLPFKVDAVWASPPCQTYSLAACGKHRTARDMKPKTPDARLGKRLLTRTVEIINFLRERDPGLIYYMENPRGLMQHETNILKRLSAPEPTVVSYCRYGFDYRKHTHVWTNDAAWKCKAKACSSGCKHGKPCKREKGGYLHDPLPKDLDKKYQIPSRLIREIFTPRASH